jgi:hypothetical protein
MPALAHIVCLVLVAGKLERHAVGLHLAGLLVGVLVHTPSQHEGRLDVECGIASSIEDADALTARIVDFDFCVFDVGVGIHADAGDDGLSGFGFDCHCICRVCLVWLLVWLFVVVVLNCLPFLCPNL